MTQKASVRWQETPLEGWKKAGPDHPIYSEGPSITFLRRTPKQSPACPPAALPISRFSAP